MIYKLAPHVTDDMLLECGFTITDNSYGEPDCDDCFEAIRTIDDQYDIVLQDKTRELQPMLYDKITYGDPYVDEDIKPYIRDLIEKGMVIVE